jgi:hypothetical protein
MKKPQTPSSIAKIVSCDGCLSLTQISLDNDLNSYQFSNSRTARPRLVVEVKKKEKLSDADDVFRKINGGLYTPYREMALGYVNFYAKEIGFINLDLYLVLINFYFDILSETPIGDGSYSLQQLIEYRDDSKRLDFPKCHRKKAEKDCLSCKLKIFRYFAQNTTQPVQETFKGQKQVVYEFYEAGKVAPVFVTINQSDFDLTLNSVDEIRELQEVMGEGNVNFIGATLLKAYIEGTLPPTPEKIQPEAEEYKYEDKDEEVKKEEPEAPLQEEIKVASTTNPANIGEILDVLAEEAVASETKEANVLVEELKEKLTELASYKSLEATSIISRLAVLNMEVESYQKAISQLDELSNFFKTVKD